MKYCRSPYCECAQGKCNQGLTDARGCGAVQSSDSMVCRKCDLTWDVNDPCPPDCKQPTILCEDKMCVKYRTMEGGCEACGAPAI